MMKKFLSVVIYLLIIALGVFANTGYDPYYYYDDWYDDYDVSDDRYNDYYDQYSYAVDPYADYYDPYDEFNSTTIENDISQKNDLDSSLIITNNDNKNEIIDDIEVLGSPNNNELLELLKELQESKETFVVASKTTPTVEDNNISTEGIPIIAEPVAKINIDTQEETILEEPKIEDLDVEIPPREEQEALIKDEKNQHSFYADGTFGPTIRFLRGTNFAVGGHMAVNFFVVPEFSFGPYIHGEYFLSPLGSTSGLLAGLEMELEAGLNLTFPVFQSPHFTIKIGSDIGYYMQWLQYNSDISSDAHLTYNGLLLRPTVTFDFARLWGMPIGISFFYQVTVMMPYQDYNGFGIMLNL